MLGREAFAPQPPQPAPPPAPADPCADIPAPINGEITTACMTDDITEIAAGGFGFTLGEGECFFGDVKNLSPIF
ncbi:MAG: hypothetical protein ACUVSL_15335 [Chloroflexus sp.]|uniref:hypothetical protein n=1 Tax=Chloroflexus sp. TaxID=1904827 RepID=UPI0040495130